MASDHMATERITQEVTSWPGVAAGPGRRGEFAFKAGGREIGHLHGDYAAHFSFPKKVWRALFEQGRIDYHPVFPALRASAPAGSRARPTSMMCRADAAQLRTRRLPPWPTGGDSCIANARRHRHRRIARPRPRPRPSPRRARMAAGRRCARSRCARARGGRSRGRRRDPGRRRRPCAPPELVEAAGEQIDLLVNNAGVLGPSPQPALAVYPLSELERVYQVNVFAPLALVQEALPRLRPARRSSTSPRMQRWSPTRAGAATARRRLRSSS